MKKIFFLIIFLTLVLYACGKYEIPVPPRLPTKPQAASSNIKHEEKSEVFKKFIYRGDIYKDPFFQLNEEAFPKNSVEGIVVPALNSLVLQGIIRDGDKSMALLKSGAISYTLVNGRIYDNRQRLIKGLSGIIRPDSVIIEGRGKTKREIKLREKTFDYGGDPG